MMIKIKSIEFENYRQYKKIAVDFDSSNDSNLFVLRAKNGTGKTTFLNGILWCLYEKESYLADEEKALPIINSSLVQQSNEKEPLNAKVTITIDDGESTIIFERTQVFFVSVDPLRGIKNAVPGTSSLKIKVTPNDGFENTKVYEEEGDVQSLVKQYFDETIFDYYFFDGENLKNYFAKGKSKRIKDSINNISQVTLLTNAISRLNERSTEKARSVAKIKSGDDTIYTEIEALEKEIKRLEDENADIEANLPIYKKKFKEADDLLTGYAPIRANTKKRNELNTELIDLQKDYDSFKVKKQIFIREYLVALNFYPRAKATLDIINEKQEAGSLPPSIDKDQVRSILDNHIAKCPVCDAKIDGDAIKHLNELLDQLDVSSATSHFLTEIKGSLEQVVQKCKVFPKELKEINDSEKYYIDEIKKKEEEIENISSFLSNNADSNSSEFNVSKVESERSTYDTKIKNAELRHGLNEKDIKINNDELKKKKEERDNLEAKASSKDQLNNQVKVFRTLSSELGKVQSSIMNEIKDEIQKLTWDRFDSMIWKKNTFGSIEIDDSYAMSVYNVDGNEMTGGLSATEYMALAYSFTLAIHEASGKNCPLVVDSPLGRVSDDNRTNMAAELLKVSYEKQIIMLFTPDEFSKEVADVFENNAASIRDIILSDDEKEIEKVGA